MTKQGRFWKVRQGFPGRNLSPKTGGGGRPRVDWEGAWTRRCQLFQGRVSQGVCRYLNCKKQGKVGRGDRVPSGVHPRYKDFLGLVRQKK